MDYAESGVGGSNDVIGSIAPDAVQILTLHRAKATEYPLVWMPDINEGELPIATWPEKAQVWTILPREIVAAPSRFDGTEAEETRLCFVGVTRAMRYLFLTAPSSLPKGRRLLPPSQLLRHFQRQAAFVTIPDHSPPSIALAKLPALTPPRNVVENESESVATLTLTPSELFTYFSCPYQYRLRIGFGFPPPLVETLGHPDAIHAAICEYHERGLRGELPLDGPLPDDDLDALVEELITRHHHAPYATDKALSNLRSSATRKLKAYIRDHRDRSLSCGESVEAVEQPVEAVIRGVNIKGRLDMCSSDAQGSTIIDDHKTSVAAARRDPELLKSRVYGLGYEALTGTLPARVRTRVVGASAAHDRTIEMDEVIAEDTRLWIADAGRAIALNVLPARPAEGGRTCRHCDPAALCYRGRGLQRGSCVSK